MSLTLFGSIVVGLVGLLGIGVVVANVLFGLSEDPRGPGPHRDDE